MDFELPEILVVCVGGYDSKNLPYKVASLVVEAAHIVDLEDLVLELELGVDLLLILDFLLMSSHVLYSLLTLNLIRL